MKIVIAHLYYDLLNLYGESGNVKALIKYFENQNIEIELKELSLSDEFDFSEYDLVYIGMGTENNQLYALEHLLKYKKDIKQYIQNNGFILATGNSLELFGKYILDFNKDKHKALGIFSYYSSLISERIICESILEDSSLDKPIIGFQNRGSKIINNKNYWFSTIKNYKPENNTDLKEGIRFNNFYGTYLLGPILARNPHLLKILSDKIIISKNKDFEIKEIDFDLEVKAYEIDRKRYEEK